MTLAWSTTCPKVLPSPSGMLILVPAATPARYNATYPGTDTRPSRFAARREVERGRDSSL